MAYKPILFSTTMVQANLAGRKTQTRRVIKPLPDENGISYMPNAPLDWEFLERKEWCPYFYDTDEGERIACHPRYRVGDVLWVRETYKWEGQTTFQDALPMGSFLYKADKGNESVAKWKPSIFMPREAARLFLEVTDVRVERLQDISEDDAIAEGVERVNGLPFLIRWKNYMGGDEFVDAKDSFKSLWQSINGQTSWDANPWVWVYDYKQTISNK